jgi:NTP pyrophosphatase (non-canonical NTP hydrolase)
MGHQGGKVTNPLIREQFFKWLEELEYQILGLPKPDAVFFFHMPHLVSLELKKNRIRKSEFHPSTEDGHESNLEHLKNAENAYLQLASLYNWKKISCAPDGTISSLRTPENISEEFYFAITEILNKNLTLNELQEIIMKQAKEKGFGTTPEEINTPEKISLIHSEVSEAFEAFRKKNIDGKDGLKEELGDVIQRVLHLCGIYHIDVEREILKKISNNKNRVWNWDKMNEQHV